MEINVSDFVNTHSHSGDIDTSRASAEMAESMAARHKALVIGALVKLGPLSSEQIANAVGLDTLQVMKRISDLRNDGKVVDSGDRRQTKTGRMAAVWKLKAAE
jgi:predicted ArsR family transcriptional regulator